MVHIHWCQVVFVALLGELLVVAGLLAVLA